MNETLHELRQLTGFMSRVRILSALVNMFAAGEAITEMRQRDVTERGADGVRASCTVTAPENPYSFYLSSHIYHVTCPTWGLRLLLKSLILNTTNV